MNEKTLVKQLNISMFAIHYEKLGKENLLLHNKNVSKKHRNYMFLKRIFVAITTFPGLPTLRKYCKELYVDPRLFPRGLSDIYDTLSKTLETVFVMNLISI